MKKIVITLLFSFLLAPFSLLCAQHTLGGTALAPYIVPETDTLCLHSDATRTTLAVDANCDFTATKDADWLTLERDAIGHYQLSATRNTSARRTATIRLTSSDATVERQVTVIQDTAYVIYQNDFDNGTSKAPFRDGWAWEPNYITVVDSCLEFYYNQDALDADYRRERKGAEIVCDFSTNRDGWYGFRIFLPEGKFSKDITNSIFCQIFNSGSGNSWAGHLSLCHDSIIVSHRHALVDPARGYVGKAHWEQWIPIVVYFKAGLNNKGRVRVWMGDDMVESQPAYDSGPCRFGFGSWIDDETMNNVVSDDNPKATCLGPKLGLYVSLDGDRTIRFDDIKLVEGNPLDAFNIVRPK